MKNLGGLGDLIGPDLTKEEDLIIRKVRRYLWRHPGQRARHACEALGLNLRVYWQGMNKLGKTESTYNPDDIATEREAFSFSQRVGDGLSDDERIEAAKKRNRERSMMYAAQKRLLKAQALANKENSASVASPAVSD